MTEVETKRYRVTVVGIVQGVGFRPYVYGLATRLGLSGCVWNSQGHVLIEVQGNADRTESFLAQLPENAPPLAVLEEINREAIQPRIESSEFCIVNSDDLAANGLKFLPPDSATCDQCLSEVFDKNNRRYRYPFINCTNCGPRFTIIQQLPYDRPFTTMRTFEMCQECKFEYHNPLDRRFHAQPNACPNCGPQLSLVSQGRRVAERGEALAEAVRLLLQNEVVAVKGLGGFHLMVRAECDQGVNLLRSRKRRVRKPFAVMMRDLETVGKHCELSSIEAAQLLHVSRPIVLLERKAGSRPFLSSSVAPGINRLGVMLPYTALHHLLLRAVQEGGGGPVVATSGNMSEEPIAITNEEARERLAGIASAILEHDREICSRADDSVVHLVNNSCIILRRSRGIAPKQLRLPFKAARPVLACGAHLKNTFCLVRDNHAYVSQHIGDLENLESYDHFLSTLETYLRTFDLTYEIIAHDMHPDYLSTSIAEELAKQQGAILLPVQHHHAHIAACMADNRLTDKQEVIGIAFDGSGFGIDGTIWGGEFFLCSYGSFRRVASLKPVLLPGGNLAVKQPWRMTLSYLDECEEDAAAFFLARPESNLDSRQVNTVIKQMRQRIASPYTSSVGRLFDAVAALIGICVNAEYEGQAAMELEALACSSKKILSRWDELSDSYPYEVFQDATGMLTINCRKIFQHIAGDLANSQNAAAISRKFHMTIAAIVEDLCCRIRATTAVNKVCLGGGVFQNKLLLSMVMQLLTSRNFEVLIPQNVPPNDGGLSVGQAAVALAQTGQIHV